MGQKETILNGIPFKLKKASELFEKVNNRWQLKVANVADAYITRSHPFDIVGTNYDKKTKKLNKWLDGNFYNLSEQDRATVINAFSYRAKNNKEKKVNKFYLVPSNYDELLAEEMKMRKWVGNDKLRKQYYYAQRNGDFKKMDELIKKMNSVSKSKK